MPRSSSKRRSVREGAKKNGQRKISRHSRPPTVKRGGTGRTKQEIVRHFLALEQQALLEAQRALERSRDRYAELYDAAPVAYITLDRTGTIQQVNLAGA